MLSTLLNKDVATLLPVVLAVMVVLVGGILAIVKAIFTGWRGLVTGVADEITPMLEKHIREAMRERAGEAAQRHAELQKTLEELKRSMRRMKRKFTVLEQKFGALEQKFEEHVASGDVAQAPNGTVK